MITNRKLEKLLLMTAMMIPMISFSCPCFHRYYLDAIFSSEKEHFSCEIRGTDENRHVFLTSHNPNLGRQASNFGEVASTSSGCLLVVDNQVISEEYASLDEKDDCDEEILMVCERLQNKNTSLMYPGYD